GSLGHVESLSRLFLQCLSRSTRALAGAGVGAGALTAHRQTTTVTETAIATDVHQTLDVHSRFATQITLDRVLSDLIANLFELSIVQILDLLRIRNAASLTDLAGAGATDTIDGRQADLCVLMRRNVDASDTC